MIEVRAGHVACTSTDGDISFGRSATCTIKLDADREDRRLSRVTGTFRREADRWHLYNLSDRLDLTVEIDGGLVSLVKPGAWPVTLPSGSRGTVAILTPRRYSVAFDVAEEPMASAVEAIVDLALLGNEPTTEDMATALRLTDAELAMLVALCESRLRQPSSGPWFVPPTRDVCRRLGVTPKRAEDLVDALAVKMAPFVEGLLGDNRSRATLRRQRIADFALQTRCVTAADLGRLPRT